LTTLREKESGAAIGEITDEQLQFLMDKLEEESGEDTDYYIDGPTIDMLADAGADPALVDLLRAALGDRDGIEVLWSDA
jgi:processive 1,2-diacylglycerol beta-glucosyltransferase